MRRCDGWAACSALTTAAWRCRKTSTVRHSASKNKQYFAVFVIASLQLFCRLAEKQDVEDGAKRKRGPAKSVCPYNKASALQQMRNEILGSVHDVEHLLKLGKETHSCPYYAARLTVPPAQVSLSTHCSFSSVLIGHRSLVVAVIVSGFFCGLQLVVLPYQMVLHEATRRAAGVQLKGQVW